MPMKKLQDNWLTEGLIDFEYKKYLVLAYLQSVKQEFDGQKLYPTLSDLVFHYRNLLAVRDQREVLYQHFPQEISKADFLKLQLSYRKMVEDDEVMQSLTELLLFAIPKFQDMLENGRELYEALAAQLELEPVGITPIRRDEGYVFMQPFRPADTLIYYYQLSLFDRADGPYRGLHFQLMERIRKGVGETYEGIKLRLVRQYQQLPNPATYLITAKVPCPFEESLLPISKRVLLQHLMRGQDYS
jgi:hypothetical protein